jgi:hypothetical protein
VATPFLMSHHSTKIIHGRTRWWLRSTIEEYDSTGCNPLLDKKGAIVKKLKNPILKEEVLMCHCWHNFASPIAGGTACALLCYDSKTKTQYTAGKCPACSCCCAFVCTKK